MGSRDNLVLWRPGQSGNKLGRPRGHRALRKYLRAHTKDATDALIAIARDISEPAQVRMLAACAILDRGWGKPSTEEVVAKMDGEFGGGGDLCSDVVLEQLESVGITRAQVMALAKLRMEDSDGDTPGI